MRFAKPVALSVVFGLLGLGVALLFGKPEDFLEIRNLSGRTLLISALLLALSFVCGGLRLQLLGRTLGYALRLPSAARAHILGAFSAAVTPSGSGNALAIALMLRRDGLSQTHAWSVALYTSVADLLFYAWFAPLSLLTLYLSGRLPGGSWLLAGGLAASALFLGLWYLLVYHFGTASKLVSALFRLPLIRRFQTRAEVFMASLTGTLERISGTTWPQHILLQLLTVGTHVSVFAIFSAVAADLGLSLPVLPTIAVLFLVFAVSHLVPTPGGSGFFEVSIPLLLSPDAPAAIAPAVLVWRLIAFYSSFLLAPPLGGAALAKRLGPEGVAAAKSEAG